MSSSNNKNTSSGVSFLDLLTLLFIALKLMGYINWSWWWILSPAWIPVAIVLTLYLICYIGGTIK